MNYKYRTKNNALQFTRLIKVVLPASLILVILLYPKYQTIQPVNPHFTKLTSSIGGFIDNPEDSDEDFDFQFNIQDLVGTKYPFDKFKDKVIFLNLWATWCRPCRIEMPAIQSLYNKIDKDKIVFVMLSIDRDNYKYKVVDYVRQQGYTFPVYMPSGYLPEQLKVPSIPTTFIISRDGKIVRKLVGTENYDKPKFQKFLEELSQ